MTIMGWLAIGQVMLIGAAPVAYYRGCHRAYRDSHTSPSGRISLVSWSLLAYPLYVPIIGYICGQVWGTL